jgi:hypothetical protein
MGEHSHPEHAADSAGVPWEGRSFGQHSDEFANDSGLTPPELAEAIAQFRLGAVTHQHVSQIFASSRVLVPLLAVAGEVGETPDGRMVDKTQELSIVTVEAPDGRKVLPVFSSVEAMQRWNPDARPVPNFGRTVAIAALSDGNDLVILDPTNPSTQFGFRRPTLFALSNNTTHVSCWEDPDVRREFEQSISAERAIHSIQLTSGDTEADLASPELEVSLRLSPGLGQRDVDELLTRLQVRWAASETIAERVDSLTVRLTAAT